ncbi:MAG: putative DNA binding domain-containing protein [Bacteroidota bacterium]|nr:putative DNA binding domain-containing protein [Bacteroidota bacterium]
MTPEKLAEIIQQGEGIEVEFKSAQNGLPENLYETVCAFLNRNGGHLFLGVDDHKNIVGIEPSRIQNYINQIVVTVNNPQKINPPFFLSPENISIQGKQLIYIYVPESSQVHSTSGIIFDRNNDGDFHISKNSSHISALYQKKQQTFTENKIYPYLQLSDLREDLFVRIRKMAANNRPNHPWLEMNDLELMKSSSLYQKDYLTGQQGFTFAATLLLGKDAVIQSIVPAYKTDAILRVHNLDRYDDRDDVRTNLIESYDRLMAFVQKHLPDKFYEEPDAQRRSLRSVIFHEVIINLLGHREFTNPFPAKLIIEANKVKTENWCKPHGHGAIDPYNFTPQTKNPNIAKFFREIGRFEELGSGVRNIFKYTKFYSNGQQPELVEGDIFKISIPIAEIQHYDIEGEAAVSTKTIGGAIGGAIEEISKGVTMKVKEKLMTIITAIHSNEGKKTPDLINILKVSERSIERYLKQLREAGLIEFKGNSALTGGYYLTEKMKAKLN